MRRLGFVGLLFAVTAAPFWARHDTGSCGTTPTTPAEVLFRHRQAERARATRLKPLAAAAPSTNRDIGNVAVIENTDGVVDALNQFDLDNATLTFTPAAGGTSGVGRASTSAVVIASLLLLFTDMALAKLIVLIWN